MNRFRIMVVDDDPITRQMLALTLQSAGFETHCATDGADAVEQMKETPCPLVICDWNMPRMNGLELCEHVRKHSAGGYVYIVMLTSNHSAKERVMGLRAGADDFVVKPFDRAELLARVQVARRVLQLETREALIFSLAKLAESRDPETGKHLERVRRYSRLLAEQLAAHPDFAGEITTDFLQLIYLTSPLHDIGKVGIPDSILLKPGRLTPAEFGIIQRHPDIGAETLQGAIELNPDAGFLRMAYDITRYHHEKFDGSGYPCGLAGDDIPLSARLVSLADVYDALTTRRVYKAAMSHEEATHIILESRGGHFDPRVVDAFLQIESEFEAIAVAHQDPVDAHPPLVAQLMELT